MNAKRSWIVWIVAVILFAAGFAGFVSGAKMTDADGTKGAIWMVGSVLLIALTVFLSYKVKGLKK